MESHGPLSSLAPVRGRYRKWKVVSQFVEPLLDPAGHPVPLSGFLRSFLEVVSLSAFFHVACSCFLVYVPVSLFTPMFRKQKRRGSSKGLLLEIYSAA